MAVEEFDFDYARALKREVIAHLGTLDFVTAKTTWCSSGRRHRPKRTWRSG